MPSLCLQLGFADRTHACRVAELIPLLVPGLELVHLVGLGNGMQIAPGEIAIDLVLLDAMLTSSALASSAMAKHLTASALPSWASIFLLAGREAGANLPAIAPRSAVSDPFRFKHHDLVAGVRQLQGRRKPGIACADHANIGGNLALEAFAFQLKVSGCLIIGLGID